MKLHLFSIFALCLLGNDCFDGMKLVDGRITLEDKPGLGLTKKPGIISI